MMYYGDDGKTYTVEKQLGKGGAGTVYTILGEKNRVAKIFHKREKQRDLKIKALRQLEWSAEIERCVALPKVVLYEDFARQRQCGFIMKTVSFPDLTSTYAGSRPLSIRKRAIVGLNLCKTLKAIHHNDGIAEGALIMGDFNFKNIAVDHLTGNIQITDVDSFHLTLVRKNGTLHVLPCTELYPDFFPPEILGLQRTNKNATLEQLSAQGISTFTLYTDYFCLAYHLHLLLLNCAPFSCALPSSIAGKDSVTSVTALPTLKDMVMNGNYCYSNLKKGTRLPDYCPDFNIITPELQQLFICAFQNGARQPELRPSPDEFIKALEPFIESLNYCACDGWNHYLHKSWKKDHCEWCRVDDVLGVKGHIPNNLDDIFYMNDQELEHFRELPEVQTNGKTYAYVLYEIACRYYHRGHNGESRFQAKQKDLAKHLALTERQIRSSAPELLSKLSELKSLGIK